MWILPIFFNSNSILLNTWYSWISFYILFSISSLRGLRRNGSKIFYYIDFSRYFLMDEKLTSSIPIEVYEILIFQQKNLRSICWRSDKPNDIRIGHNLILIEQIESEEWKIFKDNMLSFNKYANVRTLQRGNKVWNMHLLCHKKDEVIRSVDETDM